MQEEEKKLDIVVKTRKHDGSSISQHAHSAGQTRAKKIKRRKLRNEERLWLKISDLVHVVFNRQWREIAGHHIYGSYKASMLIITLKVPEQQISILA